MLSYKKFLRGHWMDFSIAFLLLFFLDDIRWFLLFALFEILFAIFTLTGIVSLLQTVNDIRFIALMRKNGITNDDLETVFESTKPDIGQERWEEIVAQLSKLSK